MNAPVELEIPSKRGYVGVVRLTVASLARKAGMDEERVDELKIAVSEACTDAVLASEEAGIEEPISVRWSETPEQVVVEISDRVGESAQSKLEDSQGFSTRHAMAAALMTTLVDELDTTTGPSGTVTRMTLSLNAV